MFEFVDTGMLIKEFFDLGTTWHNYNSATIEGGDVVGTYCDPNERDPHPHRLFHIMPDKTICTTRSAGNTFVGWNPGLNYNNPLTYVKADSPHKLVFKDVEVQHRITTPVVTLELESHPGKALVWDDEDMPPRQESYDTGRRRYITIGDAKDAIRVFMDDDKRFCWEGFPYLALDSNNANSRKLLFQSKAMGYSGRQ